MTPRLLVCATALALGIGAAPPPQPPRYVSGALPDLPAMALGGGEVFLQAGITVEGRVAAVTVLRETPPFAEALVEAVKTWRFRPARNGQPAASSVLVAAIYRPPAFQGPSLGQLPRNVTEAAPPIPYPLATAAPGYPPQAGRGASVLVEVEVEVTGAVGAARVLRHAPPFDTPALVAARQWRFRPARVEGVTGASIAYLVFGFPTPVG